MCKLSYHSIIKAMIALFAFVPDCCCCFSEKKR